MFRDFTKYEVYEDGKIWSYSHNKWLKPQKNEFGYQIVRLSDNYGNAKTYLVHRVVFEAVTGEPIPEGMQVNHINEIKTDNRFCNLNIMTCKENIRWGSGIERCHKAQSKRVGAFKNNELVITFSSTNEAGRQGFNQSSVAACCNGKRKTHKGYEWRYLDN